MQVTRKRNDLKEYQPTSKHEPALQRTDQTHMISTMTAPKTKTDLMRTLQAKNFDFSLYELSSLSHKQKLVTAIDQQLRKSPVSVLIIREK